MPKRKKQAWMCPVCDKKAGGGTFICTICLQWTHAKCGGYDVKSLKKHDKLSLVCNNCKPTQVNIKLNMKFIVAYLIKTC